MAATMIRIYASKGTLASGVVQDATADEAPAVINQFDLEGFTHIKAVMVEWSERWERWMIVPE